MTLVVETPLTHKHTLTHTMLRGREYYSNHFSRFIYPAYFWPNGYLLWAWGKIGQAKRGPVGPSEPAMLALH